MASTLVRSTTRRAATETLTGLSPSRALHSGRHLQTSRRASCIALNSNAQDPILRARLPSLCSSRLQISQQRRQIGQMPQEQQKAQQVAAQQEATVHAIHEPVTGSWQYVIADPETSQAIVLDPVLNYDAATASISTQSADSILSLIKEHKYTVAMILETHAHADHLTAADYLKKRLAALQGFSPPVGIGRRISDIQKFWGNRFGIPEEDYSGAFDKLIDDNEEIKIGNLTLMAMHLPGHTPDHMGYMVGDNVFVGDSIFNADLGTARADFPGGCAKNLFRSGRKLLKLPDHVKIWSGHDYPPEGQTGRAPWTTVRDQRAQNKHVGADVNEDEYVMLRQKRDATLKEPKLMNQSLQINIRAGRLPPPSVDGTRMMHIPLKLDALHW